MKRALRTAVRTGMSVGIDCLCPKLGLVRMVVMLVVSAVVLWECGRRWRREGERS